MLARLIVVVAGLMTTQAVEAQQVTNTGPIVLLSEAMLLPTIHYLFLISGGLAIQQRLREGGSKRLRWEIPLICFLILVSSGGPPLALMVSTGLAIVGIKRGLAMFRISTSPLARRKGLTHAIRVASIAAICVAVLLGGSAYALYGHWLANTHFADTLRNFASHQQQYARSVGCGQYATLEAEFLKEDHWLREKSTSDLAIAAGNLYAFSAGTNPLFDMCVVYDDDGTGYEVFAQERRVVPWPYRLLSPTKSYYMNQTGVIYHRDTYAPLAKREFSCE